MKKTVLISATALLILTACSDNKEGEKKQTLQQEQKVEVTQEIKTEKKIETNIVNQEKAQEQEKLVKSIEEQKVVDAQTLFKSCSSCHGQKGEKEALGKSQVIAGWDKNRVISALNGYKDGTYGGAMKSVMKPHVDNKTVEEIEAIAIFISNL